MSFHNNNTNDEVVDATGAGGALRTGTQEEDSAANKRAALAGQWRTPPMPAYPSGYAPAPPPSDQGVSHVQSVQCVQQQIAPLPSHHHHHHHQLLQSVHTTTMGPAPAPTGSEVSTNEMLELPNPSTLPGTSEDYAKALQEAYRKGAEAAARIAQQQQQQQQQQLPTAASCPNFQTGPPVAPPPGLGSSPPLSGYQQHPPPSGPSGIPDPLRVSMPPLPPPPHHHHAPAATSVSIYDGAPQQLQQQQVHQTHLVTYVHSPPTQPTGQPQPQQQQQNQQYPHPGTAVSPHQLPHPPQAHTHGGASGGVVSQPHVVTSAPPLHHGAPQAATTNPTPPPGRSISMPDMSAYAAKAEQEKRQKRLARNRASARLRRLRKKNLVRWQRTMLLNAKNSFLIYVSDKKKSGLVSSPHVTSRRVFSFSFDSWSPQVDAYETEVGILEKTLRQLRAHEWGKDDDHNTLLEALGMERGQQAIGPEQRTEIIRDILKQQMEQVELLRQAQVEQECLALVANMEENGDDELCCELQELLQLTDIQKAELRESSKGLDQEVQALETVAASLRAMQENDWLLNEGAQKITDQFTSILHKNQQSKFLLWTDANAEAIDQLDYVQVQPLQSAPIFSFGVESAPIDDDEKQ
jgi:hypothetical protein